MFIFDPSTPGSVHRKYYPGESGDPQTPDLDCCPGSPSWATDRTYGLYTAPSLRPTAPSIPPAAQDTLGSLCSQQGNWFRIDDGRICFLITRNDIKEEVSSPSLPHFSLLGSSLSVEMQIKQWRQWVCAWGLGVSPTAPAPYYTVATLPVPHKPSKASLMRSPKQVAEVMFLKTLFVADFSPGRALLL